MIFYKQRNWDGDRDLPPTIGRPKAGQSNANDVCPLQISEKTLVRLHNNLIDAKYRLSLASQRLLRVLISMVESGDEDFKPCQIQAVEFAKLFAIKSGIYTYIENAAYELVENELAFEKPAGGGEEKSTWAYTAEYMSGSGVVELCLSPDLKPLLLKLKEDFTSYELGNILELKHVHSIRIYELLKRHEKTGRKSLDTESFREFLTFGDHEHRQFCDLRRWVLEPARAEINGNTDISFDWRGQRRHRACVAIHFTITKQQRQPIRLQQAESDKKHVKAMNTKEQNDSNSQESNIHSLMLEVGVSPAKAKHLVKTRAAENLAPVLTCLKALSEINFRRNPDEFFDAAMQELDTKKRESELKSDYLQSSENIFGDSIDEYPRLGRDLYKVDKNKLYRKLEAAFEKARDTEFSVWCLKLDRDQLRKYMFEFTEMHPPEVQSLTFSDLYNKPWALSDEFARHLKLAAMGFDSLMAWAIRNIGVCLNVSEFENEIKKHDEPEQQFCLRALKIREKFR